MKNILVTCFAAVSIFASAADLYVSTNGIHEVGGVFWGTYRTADSVDHDAYTNLQQAVNAALSGDTVWVEDGFVCDASNGATAISTSRSVRLKIPRKMTVRTRSGTIENAAVIRGDKPTYVGGVVGSGVANNTLQGFIIEDCAITAHQNANAAEYIVLSNCFVRNCSGDYNMMNNVRICDCIVSNCVGSTYAGLFQNGNAYNTLFINNGSIGTCGAYLLSGNVVSNCVFTGHRSGGPVVGVGQQNPPVPPLVIDCVFSNNAITSVGSQYNNNLAITVRRCLFTGNSGASIAPMYNGTQRYNNRVYVYDSVFTNNSGKAIDSCGEVYNCLFDNNTTGVKINNPDANTPLGLFNCTVYGGVGGNTFAVNSIIKANPAVNANTITLTAATNCCLEAAATVATGKDNITAAECLLSRAKKMYTPTEMSPCLKGGSVTAYQLTDTDITGRTRQYFPGYVAIGAYEYNPNFMVFEVGDVVFPKYLVAPASVMLNASASGFGFNAKFYWDVDGDGVTDVVNDSPSLTYPFPAGTWQVGLCASNIEANVGSRIVFDPFTIAARGIHYVKEGNWDNARSPYDTVQTASATVQAAVDACVEADEVVILPGLYTNATEVSVTKPITVRGSTGNPADVVIRHVGGVAGRCLRVNSEDAVVHSLTCENGFRNDTFDYGAGVLIGSTSGINSVDGYGTVSNLVVRGCRETSKFTIAPGIYAKGSGAFITHCVVSNCYSSGCYIDGGKFSGLGIHITDGAKAENCLIIGNYSGSPYNGKESNLVLTNGYYDANFQSAVFVGPNSVIRFSTIVNNRASYCGGVNVEGTGRFEYCIIAGNKVLCNFLKNYYEDEAERLNVWTAFPSNPGHSFYRGASATAEQKAGCWNSFTNIVESERRRVASTSYFANQTTNAVDSAIAGLGAGTVVSSPSVIFRNFAKGDYTFKSGSPVCDVVPRYVISGFASGDLGGNPRLMNGAYDLGCYECQSPRGLRILFR